MAILFDSSALKTSGGVNPFSWSHTITGFSPVLLVGVISDSTSNAVTGITYNGVALTKIDSQAQGGNVKVEFWYLKAPATGTNTVQVTMTSTGDTGAFSLSYTGVDQAAPIDASAGTTGVSGTNPSLNLTTISTNSLVVDALALDSASISGTPGASQTERVDAAADTWNRMLSSEQTAVSIGTYTMSWTPSSAIGWAQISAALKSVNSNTVVDSTAPVDTAVLSTTAYQQITDGTTVTDTAKVRIGNYITVTDSTAPTDSTTISIKNYVSVTDTAAPGDSATVLMRNLVSVLDTAGVGDVVQIQPGNLVPAVVDSTSPNDVLQIQTGLNIVIDTNPPYYTGVRIN